MRTLHSDSSTHGWAGIDLLTGDVVQEYWRTQIGLHINIKELRAALDTKRSLAKPRKKGKDLCGQYSSTFIFNKGGEVTPLQSMDETNLDLVNEKQNAIGSSPCTFKGRFGGSLVTKGPRPWGLYTKQIIIFNIKEKICKQI